jgi:hypothetical protein
LLYWTIQRFGRNFVREPIVWLFGAMTLLPSAFWYWHAEQIAQRFYPHHFFGAGGFTIEALSWYWRIAKQTALSSLTPVLTLLGMAGAIVAPHGKYRRAFHWWAAAMVVFVVAAGWGNRHQWYQLPFVPIAAVFAGCACQWISGRHRGAVLGTVAAAFLLMAFFAARPFFAPAAAPLRDLGLALRRVTPPGALIIAADDGDPTIFYYAERKGWHFLEKDGVFDGNPLDDAQLIADFDRLRARGASYIVFSFGTDWWLEYYRTFAQHLAAASRLVEATPNYAIYELQSSK